MKNVFLIVLVSMIASGCSTLMDKKTDEEIVQERTQQWLNALLARDIDKAWAYTSPGYRSNSDSKTYYRSIAGSASWTAGEVDSVKCDEARCEVTYLISYNLPQFKLETTRPLKNVWIKVDGKWWIYQR